MCLMGEGRMGRWGSWMTGYRKKGWIWCVWVMAEGERKRGDLSEAWIISVHWVAVQWLVGHACLCCPPPPLHCPLPHSVFELQQLVEGHQESYLLCWDQSQNQVQVVLNQKAGPKTILRAATHGLMLGALQGDGPLPAELEELRNRVRAGPKKESWVVVKETHEVLDMLFPKFLKGLQDAGWKTEKHQLEVDEWRATWLLSPEKKVL
uniref:Isoform 2 of RUS family member 1 n=1 Tax=Homo sapiens TaxID=9606 RepID=Q96GQ5-2